MENQYDVGAKEDFDNMTFELGQEVTVFSRKDTLNHEDQQSDTEFYYDVGILEVVFMQELNSEEKMVKEGMLKVGDVKFTFESDSIIKEQDKVVKNSNDYKVLKLTKVRGMSNDEILFIKAFGKKQPNR